MFRLIFAIAVCCVAFNVEARNVLMIVIDDMRVDSRAITPNIDALAAESTVYTQAYTAVPSCMGSRVTVFSGLSPATHGFTNSGIGGGALHDAFFNDPNTPSLQKSMANAGYYTASVGKVLHNPMTSQWDEVGPHIPYTEQYDAFSQGPDGTYIDAAPLDPNEAHPDQIVADWASDFIANHSGGDFFLAVGFYRPHLPWRLPASYYSLYPGVTAHVPDPNELNDEPLEAVALANAPAPFGIPQYDWIGNKADDYTRYYLAGITHTDYMVGQVLQALENSPYADNTDIVLWSDHGFSLAEHRHWRKADFWQPTVRAPLMIKSPALPQGTVNSATSFLDIAPTVLAISGVSPEPKFEGVSLLTGRSQVKIYWHDAVASLFWGIKLIDYDPSTPGNGNRAAYFYLSDPGETTNVVNTLFP